MPSKYDERRPISYEPALTDPRDAEIARLKAELATLKPKPVGYEIRMELEPRSPTLCTQVLNSTRGKNLRLTFLNGELVSAEVINPATNNCEATGDADK